MGRASSSNGSKAGAIAVTVVFALSLADLWYAGHLIDADRQKAAKDSTITKEKTMEHHNWHNRTGRRTVKPFEWTARQPQEPCLFVTRDWVKDHFHLAVHHLVYNAKKDQLVVLNADGKRECKLENFTAQEYMIIEEH